MWCEKIKSHIKLFMPKIKNHIPIWRRINCRQRVTGHKR